MLVACVIHDQLCDYFDVQPVCFLEKGIDICKVTELWKDREVVADVVAAVPKWRLIEGQKPDAVDAEPLQVVESFG